MSSRPLQTLSADTSVAHRCDPWRPFEDHDGTPRDFPGRHDTPGKFEKQEIAVKIQTRQWCLGAVVRRGAQWRRTTPGSPASIEVRSGGIGPGSLWGHRGVMAGWSGRRRVYLTRASFPRVRRQRVQMSTRTGCPWSTTCLRWTLGRKSRLVRRFEKLTFLPNVLVLPQTSHWATGVPPCRTSAPDARSARLAEV